MAAGVEAGKETAHSKKSKEMVLFVERQTLENVVLTSDKSDVAKLGRTKNFVESQDCFFEEDELMILQTKRTAGDLGSVIANSLNSKGYRAAFALEMTKKSGHAAASTKPQCIISDGTIISN